MDKQFTVISLMLGIVLALYGWKNIFPSTTCCNDVDSHPKQLILHLDPQNFDVPSLRTALTSMNIREPVFRGSSGKFLIYATAPQLRIVSQLPFVKTVKQSPPRDKLHPSLKTRLFSNQTTFAKQAWQQESYTLQVLLLSGIELESSDDLAQRILRGLRRSARRLGLGEDLTSAIKTDVQSAAQGKVLAQISPASMATEAAWWLARQPQVVWIEPAIGAGGQRFVARNSAAARLILSGPSELARTSTALEIDGSSLDGSGQVIAVADTGVDFDHYVYKSDPNSTCTVGPFAALLASPDLVALAVRLSTAEATSDAAALAASRADATSAAASVAEAAYASAADAATKANFIAAQALATLADMQEAQLANKAAANAAKEAVSLRAQAVEDATRATRAQAAADAQAGRPLLDGGSAEGASNVRASVDVATPSMAARRTANLRFSMSPGDPVRASSALNLLHAWAELRPQLLPVLIADDAKRGLAAAALGQASENPSSVQFQNGLPVLLQSASASSLGFEANDPVAAEMAKMVEWRRLIRPMSEACLCFLATPGPATVSELAQQAGPVPPARELMALSQSTVASARSLQGLPLLDPAMLAALCNSSSDAAAATAEVSMAAAYASATGATSQTTVQKEVPGCRNVTFKWGKDSLSLNPCSLSWDPRQLHTAVATCFSAKFLGPNAVSNIFQNLTDPSVIKMLYTHGVVKEWWKEYTRVPPVNRSDPSRRKVVGYYSFRRCRESLATNTDTFIGISPEHRNFSDIGPNRSTRELRLIPMNSRESTLDVFEARNVPHRAEVLSVVAFKNSQDAIAVQANLSLCVVVGDCTDWTFRCLLSEGGNGSNPSSLVQWSLSTPPEELWESKNRNVSSQNLETILWSRSIYNLPLSANGWCFIVKNPTNRTGQARIRVTLYRVDASCGDLFDGAAGPTESSRSVPLRPSPLPDQLDNPSALIQSQEGTRACSSLASLKASSLMTSIEKLPDATHCDGTDWSGRQLDLCWVCGGSCLPPECSLEFCPEINENLIRLRYVGGYVESSGVVSKTYQSPLCPSSSTDVKSWVGPVKCLPMECFGVDCKSRLETYKINVDQLQITAGNNFTFEAGTFLIDSFSRVEDQRLWALNIFTESVSYMHNTNNRGLLTLSPNVVANFSITSTSGDGTFKFPTGRDRAEVASGQNFSNATLIGTIRNLSSLLVGLTYTAPNDDRSGEELENWQAVLGLKLSVLNEMGEAYSAREVRLRNRIGLLRCAVNASTSSSVAEKSVQCVCRPGWAGAACDVLSEDLMIRITITPRITSQRLVWSSISRVGPQATLAMSGHGTHTAVTAAGAALPDSSDPSAGIVGGGTPAAAWNSMSSGAKLAIVDIGRSGYPFLTPPDSLGEAMMGPAYKDGARIFLAPWSCQDTAGGCTLYGSSAWEIDDFVSKHPDLLVIFPTGETDSQGNGEILAPGTCRNCLTIGLLQLWPEDLAAATDSAKMIPNCIVGDCPTRADITSGCGTIGTLSPFAIPNCCTDKYLNTTYSPETLHWSSRAGPINGRIKPDLVAPGLNIISGRSDGDPNSGGFAGCRCCAGDASTLAANGGDGRSCMTARSGSSMAAASVASAAALVRQFFVGGFYPTGSRGANPSFSPSAALVRGVLLSSGQAIRRIALADGSPPRFAENDFVPNLRVGFGRPQLLRVLRVSQIVLDASTKCKCNRRSLNDTARFGVGYGSFCAAWNFMSDSRTQRCDTIFPAAAAAEELGPWCCQTWCFVDPSCPDAEPFPTSGHGRGVAPTAIINEFKDLYVSFNTCEDNQLIVGICPWRTGGGVIDTRTFLRDHSKDENIGSVPYDPVDEAQSFTPGAGAIANNETFTYMHAVAPPSLRTSDTSASRLVVTLTWTDPAGAPDQQGSLVNDLNLLVRFIPISANLTNSQSLQEIFSLPRLPDQAVTFLGNGGVVSDAANTVEQIRVDVKQPAVIEVSVIARRITMPSGPLGSAQSVPCQSFALVLTGPLMGGLTDITPFFTNPSPLLGGICGRSPIPIPGKPFSEGILVTIVICTTVGGSMALALLVYRWRSYNLDKVQENKDNDGRPKGECQLDAGGPSRPNRHGTLQQGGTGWGVLSLGASGVDGIYSGRVLVVDDADPSKSPQVSVITEYDGSTRTARLALPLPLRGGLGYTITSAMDQGLLPARGFVTGGLGLVPSAELPSSRRRDPNESRYRLQYVTNRAAQDQSRVSRETEVIRDAPYMLNSRELFEGATRAPAPPQPEFELALEARQAAFSNAVSGRRHQAVVADLSIITHGEACPHTIHHRPPRNVFHHAIPDDGHIFQMLPGVEDALHLREKSSPNITLPQPTISEIPATSMESESEQSDEDVEEYGEEVEEDTESVQSSEVRV